VKKILFLFIIILAAFKVKGQDSLRIKLKFASIYGTTGAIQTSNARTVGKFKGNVGVFENFKHDSLDVLIFSFGVHENIEVGIQSEIPSNLNPKMNFFFKVRGSEQGNFWGFKSKFLPSTAFGINKNSAFAVASYIIRDIDFSFGYNFSDYSKGMFVNFSYQPLKFVAIQTEYLGNSIGFGLRTQYRGIELSLIYLHTLYEKNNFSQKAYWRIAYNFK
jgi:hypothetical protein